jgi:hypothetical protein
MTTSADWSQDIGVGVICGTRMKEYSRTSEGEKWCFYHRQRHEFWWVVMVPDGLSHYGPTARMEGTGDYCTDLFPGWSREAVDE